MLCKLALRIGLVTAALLTLATPALAGGWAVVTLDELPERVIAGEPLTLGFMIRQHGQTPWRYDNVMVSASHAASGEAVAVRAKAEGASGHYVATLVFPSVGTWNWTIASGLWPDGQPMPALTVLGYAPSGRADQPGLLSLPLVRLTGEGREAATNHLARLGLQAPAATPAELGQALFLAKGCVVCHTHSAVAEARKSFADFSIGPNLTHLSADPTYLRRWLKDPSAIKPATAMPTLGLSDNEIESLVAFLNTTAAGN